VGAAASDRERAVLARRLEALRAELVPDARLAVWEIVVEAFDGRTRIAGWTTLGDAPTAIRGLAGDSPVEVEVGVLPDPALGSAIIGLPHRALAHLRREPRHAAELVTQLVLGEEALCLRARARWIQVRTGDGYVGWVHEGSLVRRTSDEDTASLPTRLAARRPLEGTWVVTARSPVGRTRPVPDASPACDLVQGARVAVVDRRGDWILSLLPDGLEAWIRATDAVPHERLAERFPPAGSAIVAHAAEYVGLPYLWGGTSEKGFDCSGLVQRIYGLHGIALPRDSDQQSVVGDEIVPGGDWQGIEDGDLAFFAETPGGRSTHVGILARGGRLLHASTTRNGIAWDALQPEAEGWSDFGTRLASSLTTIRRVLH
jgi:hypothetical protein